jgi:hypothetical protein
MERENKRQKDHQPEKKKKRTVFPQEDTYAPKADDTSMSSGNLVNNPLGRTRTRDLHTKISITGNDSDGQAS